MNSAVRLPALALLLGACALVVVATLADQWAFTHVSYRAIYETGWGRIIRTLGYLPFWLLVGLACYVSTTVSAIRHGAVLLMVAPTLAGGLGQVLKILIRRGRPLANTPAYTFHPFADRPFYTRDFGMPSGDVIVAFAACALLARLWPRAKPLWYALAVACALGRLLAGAHFLSDVTVAAILGWLVAAWVWRGWGTPTLTEVR